MINLLYLKSKFFDIHNYIDQSTIDMFKHEHLWLHLVGHTVLVIMPAVLLIIVARWFFKSLVLFARRPLLMP